MTTKMMILPIMVGDARPRRRRRLLQPTACHRHPHRPRAAADSFIDRGVGRGEG